MLHRNAVNNSVERSKNLAPLGRLQLAASADLEFGGHRGQSVGSTDNCRYNKERLKKRSAAKKPCRAANYLPQWQQKEAAMGEGVAKRQCAVLGNKLSPRAER